MPSNNRESCRFKIEKLEERIAPCSASVAHDNTDKHCDKGNNGFGNGGDDGSNAGKQDATR